MCGYNLRLTVFYCILEEEYINVVMFSMAKQHVRIVLAGAGSGGHIFPLVAVAERITAQYPQCEFLYIGTKSQMSDVGEAAMARMHIPTINIMTGKMRRYFSLEYFTDFFRVPVGIIQSLWHLLIFMPDAVFSKGGYASVPVVIAAWLYRIPVLTHESDATPGWANRICGKLSRYVAVSFTETKKYFLARKTVLTGNPIRMAMTQGDRMRGYQRWNFSESKPIIFVVGGSQGSQRINDAVVRILPDLAPFAQVLHVTGADNYDHILPLVGEMGFKSGRKRYYAAPFLDREEMADAYAAADLVIARAGANTITELAANHKVAILVPLMGSANNHQAMNAYSVAKAGGALVLEESNLGSSLFFERIKTILHDRDLRVKLQNNIAPFYRPDAAEMIAAGVMKMIEE